MYQIEFLTSSQELAHVPGSIALMVVTPTAGSVGDITVHDGENTAMPEIMKIRTSAGASTIITPHYPIDLVHGLYVAFGSNVASVCVQFRITGYY